LSRDNYRPVIILIFIKQKNDTINGSIMTLHRDELWNNKGVLTNMHSARRCIERAIKRQCIRKYYLWLAIMAPFSITLFMFSFLISNDVTITIFLWEISRDHFSLIVTQTLEFNGAKKFNKPIFFQSKC